MDLPSLLRAPRICWLAGRTYWVRPLTLDDWGTLLGWLDDVVPGREDRKTPPRFASDEAQAAIYSEPGRALLAWLALRDSGIPFDEAGALIEEATELEQSRLITVLFGRRRSLRLVPDEGDDLADTWWGPLASKILEVFPGLTFEAVGRMSLDQLDCLGSQGVPDENPVHEQLIIFDRMARENAARATASNGGADTVPFQGDH